MKYHTYYLVSKHGFSQHEEKTKLASHHDTERPETLCLFEVYWAPVEKHNTSTIDTVASLERAVLFSPREGSFISKERIVGVWTEYFGGKGSGEPFGYAYHEEPVAWEDFKSLLQRVPRVGWWAWKWAQFWKHNPFLVRDSSGLLWHLAYQYNEDRVRKNQLRTKVLEGIRLVFESPNCLLTSLGFFLCFGEEYPPAPQFSQYCIKSRNWVEYVRAALFWRFAFYRQIIKTKKQT